MFSTPYNPPNRFDPIDIDWEVPPPPAKLRVIEDHSKSILTENKSPDIGFRWSVNPYRGCTHGCAYCYARPYHEYLGFGAGTDFERIIAIKPNSAVLLQTAFRKRSWSGEAVCFSGITDCYQILEKKYELTRACLQVCVEHRNPVIIITRSPLILRDLDLLSQLAGLDAIRVNISIPLIRPKVAAALEPGAPPPSSRLRAISALAEAGIPVGVSLAPIIPGLSDEMIPSALTQAQAAGATWAWGGLLRLPGAVADVFERRLRESYPHQADRVLNRLAAMRGGRLNSSRFGQRMAGRGSSWQVTEALFRTTRDRLGMAPAPPFPSKTPFRRPGEAHQLPLFE
jgi:DNA repair photolyase